MSSTRYIPSSTDNKYQMTNIKLATCRLIFVICYLLFAICGCAPPSPPSKAGLSAATPATAAPTSAPSSLPPTPKATATPLPPGLVIWENLPPEQGDYLKQLGQAFVAAHPGLTVSVQHYDEPETLVRAAKEQTIDIDLALGPASMVEGLRAAGRIEPLDGLLADSLLDGVVAPAATGARRDGHLWGVPDTAGFHLLLYYNPELLKSPPADTDELLARTKKLTGEGRYGLVMNAGDPLWLFPWVAGYDGWPVDDEGRPTLDSPAMVKALSFMRKLRQAGMPIDLDYRAAQEAFLAGEAAMLIDGEWAAAALRQSDLPWGVGRLPTVSETGLAAAPLVVARYWVLVADESAAQRDMALALLSFLAAPEQQLGWAENFGLLPTQRNALADQFVLDDPFLRTSAAGMQAGRGVPPGSDLFLIFQAMREPQTACLQGKVEPEKAAAAMQEAVESATP
jgi:ABC-type glycerol-3-phosphate transport system substrate-binding protein